MALDTNFNVNPYYDDFDEDKKFLRVLFKPGYAIQARELTQLQTILQKQSDRFGGSSFKNGSVVTGAETFTQDATYIKLSSTYLGTDIVANNFTGMTILSNDESKRAEVIRVYAADLGTGDPITLMVKQLYGDAFVTGDVIKTLEWLDEMKVNVVVRNIGLQSRPNANPGKQLPSRQGRRDGQRCAWAGLL